MQPDFYQCTVTAAKQLARARGEFRSATWAPRSLWPARKVAGEAADLCKTEDNALAAAVRRPDQLRTIRTLVHQISMEAVERVWGGYDEGTMTCAQAEWRGCSMKPIPKWKGVQQ